MLLKGKVNISSIDNAVRRVLTQKYRLGLFDNPFVDPDRAVRVVHTKDYQDTCPSGSTRGYCTSEK